MEANQRAEEWRTRARAAEALGIGASTRLERAYWLALADRHWQKYQQERE